MPQRKTIPMPIGGMATAGDPASREGTLPKVKNCFLRPGPRLEKRPGWLKDTLTAVPDGLLMERVNTDGDSILMHDGGTNATSKRASNGSWSAITASTLAASDFVSVGGTIYVAATRNDSDWQAYSYDGTTLDLTPWGSKIYGETIAYFNGRVFLGQPGYDQAQVGTVPNDFETAGSWTLGGGPPTVAVAGTRRNVTIVNGATDTLTTTAAVLTTTTAGEYTWVQPIYNGNTADIPLTLKIRNATGTVVYAQKEVTAVGVQSTQTGWSLLTLTCDVPASTALYLQILVGNVSSGAATNGLVFAASDLVTSGVYQGYAPCLVTGRFIHPTRNGRYDDVAASPSYVQDPLYRIRWSQADDVLDWREANRYDCTTTPGAITVLRATDDKLYAFKEDGVVVFRDGPTDELPVVEEVTVRDVGCIGPKCIDFAFGSFFFADQNNVYRWDGSGQIEPLTGEGMREEIYETTPSVVTVDRGNREVHVVSGTRIFVYSLDLGGWTYQTVTGASDAALTVHDMWYGKPSGESTREMWALVTDGAGAKQVIKLRASQTQDNIDGTSRDIVADVIFAPLEAAPQQKLTVQRVKLHHKASASQSASTTALYDSYDGGSTWPDSVTVRIAPLVSGEDSDWDKMPLPMEHTAVRHTLRVTHTGLGGKTYFTIGGAEAEVLVRGREIQGSNPTAISSTL